MTLRRLALLILTFCIITSPILESQGNSIVGNEYRFIITHDRRWQIQGEEEVSNIIEYEEKYEILAYDENHISVIETSSYLHIWNINLTAIHISFIAPIGYLFVIPDLFDYYYDVWINTSNIYDVYYGGPVGGNFSVDVRNAENYIFEGEFEGMQSGKIIGYEYNDTIKHFNPIYGDQYCEASAIVQYDEDGVLIKVQNVYQTNDAIKDEYYYYGIERVDEFPSTQGATHSSILGTMSLLLILAISITKIRKRKNKIV